MDTQSLAAFLEVADTGSFTRAAERLHLSQPAVSKRLATLEEQVGTRLFDRVGRSVLLTDAGTSLLPYARKVVQTVEDGRRALSQLAATVSGRLSIGTSHHIGLHRLPPVLSRYTKTFPEVDLDLHFMDSEDACEAVLAGKLELGIVTLPLAPIANLESGVVWEDPLAVIVSPAHPLAERKRVELEELATHPAVLPDADTYTHRIIRAELEKRGVAPRVRLATNYLETLKMLAAIGLGWSVLPESMIDRTVRRLPVTGFHPTRQLGWVRHTGRAVSSPARALVAALA
ncbi:MAG TPA: LysR family transcriptional regulator [Nevskiaceae bacterium]|nr:LysR family transcriptional regulator [Nevskiaceae bacterium]